MAPTQLPSNTEPSRGPTTQQEGYLPLPLIICRIGWTPKERYGMRYFVTTASTLLGQKTKSRFLKLFSKTETISRSEKPGRK